MSGYEPARLSTDCPEFLAKSCSVKEIDMLYRALNVFCLHTIKLFYPNVEEIRDILLLIVQISFKAIPSFIIKHAARNSKTCQFF